MWSFFAALLGGTALGVGLAREKYQMNKAEAHWENIKENRLERGGPPGGLWVSMIQMRPDPETGMWDGHSWGYQHFTTKQWYEFANFRTEAEGGGPGMREAIARHNRLASYDTMYNR